LGKPNIPVAGSRIAVVGAGISGLASAYLLSRKYAVTLFEAGNYFGGHTNSVDLTLDGITHPVDTGFLVFNDRTYPNLIALFGELGVASHPSEMSFSVSIDSGRLEWAGTNLDTVFAQRGNLVSLRFFSMLRDILRFNREAIDNLAQTISTGETLQQLLTRRGYGAAFAESYLLPMAAAIWSASTADILSFPAQTFLQFCVNHGLLQISQRPQWRTVRGAGKEYVARIISTLADTRLRCAVKGIRREESGIHLIHEHGEERYDGVVLASHAPDSLKMLQDPDNQETSILRAVRYQDNTAWLHSDLELLPRREKVWSAWNYLGKTAGSRAHPVCVSYLINKLQPLPFKRPVIVTLNPDQPPATQLTHGCYQYAHPVFDKSAIVAQRSLPEIQGKRATWFAGAWTGYGFHEDGLNSALRIAQQLDCLPSWARLQHA
jgi:predicted NAD/FAD-binding protein